jgi:hypothetical protein
MSDMIRSVEAAQTWKEKIVEVERRPTVNHQ